MDGGRPDLRRRGAEVEEGEGSRRRKRVKEGREEGGDANGVDCTAPLLAAAVIHQRAEAVATGAPRPTATRARREVSGFVQLEL
jgi:hypothetical protein